MREIKFRAWDKTGRRFLNGFYLNTGRCKDKTEIGVWNHEESEIIFAEYPQLELSEYTGLKDKNGKEGYEADMVETINEKRNTKWVIRWNDLEAGFVLVNPEYGFLPIRKIKEMQVIGNIYENPELLKPVSKEAER